MADLEQLVATKRITELEAKIFSHFACNEVGQELLKLFVDEAFMAEPMSHNFTQENFAFISGRCSLLRDIKGIILKVREALKNDG